MVYGIGAAIVIAGAMFKLLNWPGGAIMLGLGLTTEAVIFFLSSFEPKEKELDWTKVYPELLEDYDGNSAATRNTAQGPVGEKLEEMFAQAKIDSALIDKLGQGMRHLSDTVANLSSIPDLTVATVGAMHKLMSISQDTQDYHEQVQNVTETLSALNIAYKKELQDADLRSQTTHEVHAHIADSMGKMQAASQEAEKFETELAQLSEKIASLNSIYGNMLTALKN